LAKGNAGKGGKGKGGRGGGVSLVQAATLPIEQQIAAERAANLQKAQAQMGFAKAAAAIMQQAAPRVSDNYTNAANADAGYARGLGDVAQQPLDQNAKANNDFLTQMGTPSSALHPAAPVGDIAYGLQGYIPASTLQREGAAWGSAAQLLPGDLLKSGQQQAGATLANDPTLASLQTALGSAAGKAAYEQASLNSTNAYRQAELGLRGQTLKSENAYRGAELQLSQERINQAAQQSVQRNKQAWARIGLSQRSLALRAAKSEAKKQGGGFTPDELVHIKGLAGHIAQNSKNGLLLKDGTPDPAHPPLSYKAALKQEILNGVPPSIAIQSLKEAGYKVPQNPSLDTIFGNTVNMGLGVGAVFSQGRGKERMIANGARRRGLDPAAVLAIASQEGLSGGVGDHGTSFGPFQMHAGGALPAAVWAKGPRYAAKWAWSPQGINYALDHIAAVAKGLTGHEAIAAISRGFERPADPQAEIAGAWSSYGNY